MFKRRIEALRRYLGRMGLDGLIVTLGPNRRYLTGYEPQDPGIGESAGVVVVGRVGVVLLVDARYGLTAKAQAGRWVEVEVCARPMGKDLARLIRAMGMKRVGFEAWGMVVAQHEVLARELEGVELVGTRGIVEELRARKDRAEVQAIEASLALSEGVLRELAADGLTGRSERELAWEIERRIREKGAEALAFEPIVAAGPRAAEPHATPGGKVIAEGEGVVVDIGARLGGYCSDITRTLVAGGAKRASARFIEIYRAVRQAQLKVIQALRPGMSGAEADRLARGVLAEAGLDKHFTHSLGHGVGLATHEKPSLGPGSSDKLEVGMVFTVEPGVYIPGWGGVRLEVMVEMTPEGARVLGSDEGFYEF